MGLPDISVLIGLTGQTKFISQMNAVDAAVKKSSVGMGTALAAGAAAVAVSMGLAVKAASDFESSFAGVIKTVDGLDDGMGGLSKIGRELAQDFRNLALQIPISVNELNKIGELGGQLGIARADLIGFTDTIAKLGVTTDLSTEQAALSLAQFLNVTEKVATVGMSASEQIQRIGSTIVDLGNNSATTESKIVNFAQRIAGAGATVGLTQDEILSLSAAISSVGVEAELGGTAISKVFIAMAKASARGGDELEKFAEVAGTSMEDFAEVFEEDASEAVLMFIEGLDGLSAEAAGSFEAIEDLFGSNQRLTSTLLLAANSSDKMRKSLRLGSAAFRENNALTDEARKKFSTFQSQLLLLKNVFNEAGIELGNEFLPMLTDLTKKLIENKDQIFLIVDGLSDVLKVLGDLMATPFEWIGAEKAKREAGALADLMEAKNQQFIKATEQSIALLEKTSSDALVLLNGAVMPAAEALERVHAAEAEAVRQSQKLGRSIGVDVKLSFDEAKIAAAKAAESIGDVAEEQGRVVKTGNDIAPVTKKVVERFSSLADAVKDSNIKGADFKDTLGDVKLEMVKVGESSDWVETKVAEYFETIDKVIDISAAFATSIGVSGNAVGRFATVLKDVAAGDYTSALIAGIESLGRALSGVEGEFEKDSKAMIKFGKTGKANADIISRYIGEGGIAGAMYLLEQSSSNLAGVLYELGIETEESIRTQIDSWTDLLGKVEEGSFEYEQIQDIIESLYKDLGETAPWEEQSDAIEDATNAIKTYSDELDELGIERTVAVQAEIDQLEEVIKITRQGTYEYEQMAEKLSILYSKLGMTSPWKTQADITREAEEAAKAYEQQLKELIDSLNVEKVDIESAISNLNSELEELYSQKEKVLAIKSSISAVTDVINLMGAEMGDIDFNELEGKLVSLGIKSEAFSVAWGDAVDSVISDYNRMNSDFATASDAIDSLTQFNIDLDTTQADESINALIFRWKDYLANLDPTSQAYQDGTAGLNALIKKFTEMGGIIDEDAAIDFNTYLAEQKLDELTDELDGLPTEQELDLRIADAIENLNIMLSRLADIIRKLDDIDGKKVIVPIEYKFPSGGPTPGPGGLLLPSSAPANMSSVSTAEFQSSQPAPVINPPQPNIIIQTADSMAKAIFTDSTVTPRSRDISRSTITARGFNR